MSTTPRTDAARGFHDMDTAVSAEDMAQLETELTEAKANFKEERTFRIAEIKEQMRELATEYKKVRMLTDNLRDLITAVTYADPPKLFNGVLCHEARVPVEFVDSSREALAATKEENK